VDGAPDVTRRPIRRWIRIGFLLWGTFAFAWMGNTVRTRGVASDLLRTSPDVTVAEDASTLSFQPTTRRQTSALVFICGSGVHAHAYAPLLRPIADQGYAVFIVKLPYRFAPLDAHRIEVVNRVRALMADRQDVTGWVVAGHSLGGALAARVALTDQGRRAAFVLIGTTHPRDHDLSKIEVPITKIYGTLDGVAPVDRMMANKRLLPGHTTWVEIPGGNHSQFGHYGRQLFDGAATISREAQQSVTRDVLLEALKLAEHRQTQSIPPLSQQLRRVGERHSTAVRARL
jgi:pimeloyl-ACP methyl ester carboxylesterase